MENEVFRHYIDTAIARLPERIRTHLDDVVIVVEDAPARPTKGLLLGLYEGIPVTAWGRGFAQKPPDKITLYKNNIEAVAASDEEIPHIIRETLWHELAHYFGFDHTHIRTMEGRWRQHRSAHE